MPPLKYSTSIAGGILAAAIVALTSCNDGGNERNDAHSSTRRQNGVESVSDAVDPHATLTTEDRDVAETSIVDLVAHSRRQTTVDLIAEKEVVERDEWTTEILSERLNERLKQLAKLFEQRIAAQGDTNADWGDPFFVEGAVFSAPLESDLSTRVDDTDFLVRQATDFSHRSIGVAEFFNANHDLLFGGASDAPVRVKFKLFDLHQSDAAISTKAYLEIITESPNETRQLNAQVDVGWKSVEAEHQWEVASFDFVSFQELVGRRGKLFNDDTASVLGANDCYARQVQPGIPHWLARLGREFMGQFGHHGLAVGDVNGDGREDLYVCDAGGLPNRLYIQQSDSTALDASQESGVDFMEDSVGALLLDLDNDGDQDIVVVTNPYLVFAENDGHGRFQVRFQHEPETDGYSLTSADFDGDGWLDVYLCGYNARRQDANQRGLPFPLPYHDANNGGRNYLLRNVGGTWQFEDVTDRVGLGVDNRRFSLAAAWEDYDDDGDPDLYVANDFGRNCLYRNDRDSKRFVNVADQLGVEDQASGMSVAWADYDRDAKPDLYVSNMFSAAGNRVTGQATFRRGIATQTVRSVRRMARGNTMFRNLGGEGFVDSTEATGTLMGRWAWGSIFTDVNNDGWPDLVVANGYVTNADDGDL